MRMVRAIPLAILLVIATAQTISAQRTAADERLQTAVELFALMNKDFLDQLMAQVMTKSWAPMEEKMRGSVDRATMVEVREEIERIVNSFFQELIKEYPQLYAKYFTTREMRDMIAFYQSPTGQKALRETPKLMGELMGILQRTLPDMERQVELSILEILRRRGIQ